MTGWTLHLAQDECKALGKWFASRIDARYVLRKGIDMNEIEELKQAKQQVESLANAIHEEMKRRGNEGQLWQNGMCAAWPDYEAAVSKLNALREKAGV